MSRPVQPAARGPALPEIRPRRRYTDYAMRGLLGVGTLIALVPLVLILYYLLDKGLSQWSGNFFTTDPNGNFSGFHGGIRNALIGSLVVVALASAIALPVGIGVALYLVEFGKRSWFAGVVRYFVDVMTGVPSIMFGLFIYIVLVTSHLGGSSYAGWKGSVALALLMLPIVVRSAEVVLLLVPDSLREAALALGAPRWKVVFRIVLPTATPGLVTGSLLAVARGLGETAPLLLTVFIFSGFTASPGGPLNTLPVQIYNDIKSPVTAINDRAWGAALTLVAIVLVLNIIARLFARRSRLT